MKRILSLLFMLVALSSQAQLVNRQLIVPEFGNGLVKTYFPTSPTAIAANSTYTIDLSTLANGLATAGSPNCVAMFENDLFVAITAANQRIYRFPNYGLNPATAIANVSQVTNVGNDYVGIAFDAAGNLYAAEGSYGDNNLVKYTAASGYTSSVNLGNGGLTSYFANLAFDNSGNLWASDYWNDRIVGIAATDLNTPNSIFHVLTTSAADWSQSGGVIANTNAALSSKVVHTVFSQPEGLAFDYGGNLWVANNNDGSGTQTNDAATIVKISPTLLTAVIDNVTTEAIPALSNSINGYYVWNVPSSAAGRSQLGGLQLDKDLNRIYVNEQVSGTGLWFDVSSLSLIEDAFANYQLQITSTNPGNGGLFLASTENIISNAPFVQSSPNVMLYPNPSAGQFQLKSAQNLKTVTAFDALGKQVALTQDFQNTYSLQDITAGTYFIRFELESGEIAVRALNIE